ncbi:MAG: hypothetical protein RIS75_359 [Actinomycetota bacterium]
MSSPAQTHPRPSVDSTVVAHASVGLLGSLLMMVAAIAIGWLPPTFNFAINGWLQALRVSENGQIVGSAAVILGGALLLHAWLTLGIDVLNQRLTDVRQLWAILAMWLTPLVLVPPMFSRDVYSYVAQGRLMNSGIDPYLHGVSALPGWFQLGSDPTWAESATPYGPTFLGLAQFITSVTPHSPYWSMILFKALCLIGVAISATAIARLARHHGISPAAANWLAILNPLVIMNLVVGAHNDALMIGFMVWAFVFAFENKPAFAIVMIALAAGVKPIALLAVPFVILAYLPRDLSRWQAIRSWTIGAFSTLAILAALGYGLGIGIGWVDALGTPNEVRNLLSPTTAIGQAFGAGLGFFGFDAVDISIKIFQLCGTLAALCIIAWLCLNPQGRSPIRGAGIAFLALIVLGPVVQPWYFMWALPLIAVAGIRKPWVLRAIIVGIGFFVIYGLAEINIVADSTINASDFISTSAALLIVVLTLFASPRERALIFGEELNRGLTPTSPELLSMYENQKVSTNFLANLRKAPR